MLLKLFLGGAIIIACATDCYSQKVNEISPSNLGLQIEVTSVQVGIERNVAGSKFIESIDASAWLDKDKTSSTTTLTSTKEQTRKLALSVQAGAGTQAGMSLSANANAESTSTSIQRSEAVQLTEKLAESERKRNETVTSKQSSDFDKDSGFVEVGIAIVNHGLTLNSKIRVGVIGRDSVGQTISIGSVYVTETDTGNLEVADGRHLALRVPPTSTTSPLLKTVRKKISASQAIDFLKGQLRFYAEVTDLQISTTQNPDVFSNPLDERRMQEMKGLSFIQIHSPSTPTKYYTVDSTSRWSLLNVLENIPGTNIHHAKTAKNQLYIKELFGYSTTILPGTKLSGLVESSSETGAWFVSSNRELALDSVLRPGDSVSVIYLSRDALLESFVDERRYTANLVTECRENASAYTLVSARMFSGTLLELRLKGQRRLYENQTLAAKDRVTDPSIKAILTNQETTSLASRAFVDIEEADFDQTPFLFKVDDEDARSLDDLIKAKAILQKYTTINREHIIVLKLPGDYFKSNQEPRNVTIAFAPLQAKLNLGRYQGFVDPGSKKFENYNANKQRIAAIASWRSEMPGRELNLQREHNVAVVARTSTPSKGLTAESLGVPGFNIDISRAPDFCPSGVLQMKYKGGCSPESDAVKTFLAAAALVARRNLYTEASGVEELRSHMRDNTAEQYCRYDGQ